MMGSVSSLSRRDLFDCGLLSGSFFASVLVRFRVSGSGWYCLRNTG